MTMVNKITKTLLIASALLLGTMYSAGAEHIDSVNYNYDSKKVEISGKDFEDYKGSVATVFVLKDGMTLENYKPGTDDDDKVEKQMQVVIGEDGTFSTEFGMDTSRMFDDKGALKAEYKGNAKRTYTAYVKAGNIVKKSSFVYSINITSVYDEAVAASTANSFMMTVYNNSTQLGLGDTAYGKLSDAGQLQVGRLAYADKADIIEEANGDKEKGFELLKEAVARAAYVQALNEGLIDEVVADGKFRDPEVLGLTEMKETAYKLFVSDITDDGVEKVLENIQSQNYKSVVAFQKGFAYEATIAAIKHNKESGTAHIKDALKKNNSLNGFDLTNYNSVTTNEIDLLLLNGSEWKKDDIQDILDTGVETGNRYPSSGGSGGSSSGSTGSIGGYSQNYSIGGLSTPTTPETITFTDIDTVEWAKPAIERLAKKGIVSGRGDGIFAPNDNVTRAEFLTMILNTLGLNQPGAVCTFSDVATSDWYYQPVAAGTVIGIAVGYDDGAFGAKDNIIRQDAAVMLNNAITKLGKTLPPMQDAIEFADADEISEYAAESVETLVKAGILNGSDGSFLPKENCTRAQAAVMISNLMDALGMEG